MISVNNLAFCLNRKAGTPLSGAAVSRGVGRSVAVF